MISNLLMMVIIGISSIHLLKTFVEAGALGGLPLEGSAACMQAIQAIAATDKIMNGPKLARAEH